MSTTSSQISFVSDQVRDQICDYVMDYIAEFVQENSTHPGQREVAYVYKAVLGMSFVKEAYEEFRQQQYGTYKIDDECEFEISAMFKTYIYNLIKLHW